jgi:hypothetical protein
MVEANTAGNPIMPIRFRCAYCNQLMGIARRKAGTVVRCPTCAGQVIVPDPGQVESAPEKSPARVFEAQDFGPEFQHAAAQGTSNRAGRVQTEAFALSDIEAPRGGIFLSSGMLVFLCILIGALLGAAFGAGYFLRNWP